MDPQHFGFLDLMLSKPTSEQLEKEKYSFSIKISDKKIVLKLVFCLTNHVNLTEMFMTWIHFVQIRIKIKWFADTQFQWFKLTDNILQSIYKYTLLVCLSVYLCPINVKTAEPIRSKFCVGPHMTPRPKVRIDCYCLFIDIDS